MLIDSNILIYALNSDSPKCHRAQSFLHGQRQVTFAQQNILESLRILTHPKFPHPFSASQARTAMESVLDKSTLITPTYETLAISLELITKYKIKGAEVFDAYLVATALSNQIDQIASDNTQHLQKYQEVSIFNPFA